MLFALTALKLIGSLYSDEGDYQGSDEVGDVRSHRCTNFDEEDL